MRSDDAKAARDGVLTTTDHAMAYAYVDLNSTPVRSILAWGGEVPPMPDRDWGSFAPTLRGVSCPICWVETPSGCVDIMPIIAITPQFLDHALASMAHLPEEMRLAARERALAYWAIRNFYPKGSSQAGFLGWDEVLDDVIAEDNATLARLGVAHEAIGRRLHELFDANQGQGGTKVDDLFVWLDCWFGGTQNCPFIDCIYNSATCPHASSEYEIGNRTTGESIWMPGLIWHLIETHCFFEGKQSRYRVDPEKLVAVLYGKLEGVRTDQVTNPPWRDDPKHRHWGSISNGLARGALRKMLEEATAKLGKTQGRDDGPA